MFGSAVGEVPIAVSASLICESRYIPLAAGIPEDLELLGWPEEVSRL